MQTVKALNHSMIQRNSVVHVTKVSLEMVLIAKISMNACPTTLAKMLVLIHSAVSNVRAKKASGND